MATTTAGYVVGGFYSAYRHVLGYNVYPGIPIQVRNYAARKGTRERARKAKVKKEVKKVGFVERVTKITTSSAQQKPDINIIKKDDSLKPLPLYNVWIGKFHRWRIYPFKEAVQGHRETHDPVMYNEPNAFINALIELDLKAEKKNKYIAKFSKNVSLPHSFDDGKTRTVLAFCKTPTQHEAALKGGAAIVLEKNDIRKVKEGDISLRDYDYIVAHPDILPDLLPIKGLMKKKFPSARLGNLGLDMEQLVQNFLKSIEYTVEPNNFFPEYGTTTIPFGKLDMDMQHLEENLSAILNDLHSAKPKKSGSFITRVRITSPPSPELFKIDFEQYLSSAPKQEEAKEEEDDVSEAIISPV